MESRKPFEVPECTVVPFDVADVICTSGGEDKDKNPKEANVSINYQTGLQNLG